MLGPPQLSEFAQEALVVWSWIGGWQPERLSMYAALYGVTDPEALIERLLAIRQAVNETH